MILIVTRLCDVDEVTCVDKTNLKGGSYTLQFKSGNDFEKGSTVTRELADVTREQAEGWLNDRAEQLITTGDVGAQKIGEPNICELEMGPDGMSRVRLNCELPLHVIQQIVALTAGEER